MIPGQPVFSILLGVGPSWRCLEVGGGGGSVAAWLSERVGPDGYVLATDIDPRFLVTLKLSNVEARKHDILNDELPEGSFDLVHARAVLEHLPARQEALRQLVTTLTPGGWLLVEDADFVSFVPVAVKQCGVTTVIQDPADAVAPSMPRSAAKHVEIDHKVPLSKLAPLLVSLSNERPRAERRVMPDRLKIEAEIAAGEKAMLGGVVKIGDSSLFTCPDCHGTLLKVRDEQLLRFRCHTGHAYTAQSLLSTLNETTEDTIWSAVRALQEGAMLLEHLAQHARDAGQVNEANSLDREAQDKLEQAELVRKTLAPQVDQERVSAS